MPADIITQYFPELTPEQVAQFEQLEPLYRDWNEKINLISRKDIDNLYERHVLHSLAIAKYIRFKPGSRVLDFGTGGGFPGIPLAILFPEVKFLLVDSIMKKIKVVQAISSELGLKNVSAKHKRVENLKGNFDYGVCRAVAGLDILVQWIQPLTASLLALKGGNVQEEMKLVNLPSKAIPLSDYFEEPFFEEKYLIEVQIT